MRKEQRQQEILDFLRAAGVLSPKELAEQLYMSLSTVYRDIHDLEGQKLLIRTAEGQVAIPGEQRYTPAPYKRNLYREEKIAIARSAAALIPPGATIHLDSSSTVSYMVDFLAGRQDIMTLTPSIYIAKLLIAAKIPACFCGGKLLENSQQRDLLAEGSSLLSDFGAAVEDVTFRTEGSAITVSAWAVPKTWREGMTAEFLLTSNGETTAVPGALGEGNRFSAPAVTAALTDDISLSVVFTLPDGSRETETLERWTGLLSASQPSYWPEGLLGRIVTFNQGILNARRCYLRVAWDDAFDSELYGPIEIVDWQVGVFQNHRLITWADTGADIPADVVKEFDDRNGGRKDYLGYRVLRIPDFRIAWREGDVLSIAIRARDQHGREFFFTENPDTSLGYYGNDPIWNYDLKDYGTSFQVLYQEDEAVTALPENWDFTPVPRLPET